MAAIGKERELRPHWQRVRELMLQEADVAVVSWRVRLAVLKDAKVDVTALSEPIERMMDEPPPGLLSNGKLTSWKKTNHQQKTMSDPTATARRSVADRKNSSRPKPDGQPRRSVADRKNSNRPKPDGQPRRSVADRKPKTSLFGTDSLQCSALGIHDHRQLAQHPLDMACACRTYW
jgi:hypothetical protein